MNIEFLAGLSTGALVMLLVIAALVLYKARGSRIRLGGLRMLDAAIEAGNVRKLTRERDEARRVAEQMRAQLTSGSAT